MSVLIVGSTALDSIKTPKAENPRLLGGSASHAAVAASFFGPVKLIGSAALDVQFASDLERWGPGRENSIPSAPTAAIPRAEQISALK